MIALSPRRRVAPARIRAPLRASGAALLVLTLLSSWAPVATAQNGDVTVAAKTCPATVDVNGTDPAAFAAACTPPVDGLNFALAFGAGTPRRRATAGGQPATWHPPFPGPFTLRLENSPPGTAVVFCTRDGVTTRVAVTNGSISGDPVPASGLSCQWYIVPAPGPTPTPIPAPSPTQPPAVPTATTAATVAPSPSQGLGPATLTATAAKATTNQLITNLGALPNATYSLAVGINGAGQVVGYSGKANDTGDIEWEHAFLWSSGTMTDLGTLGGDRSQAFAINDRKQVVGLSTTAKGQQIGGQGTHAFLWDNGKINDLGSLGGNYAEAYGINTAGQVVGQSETPTGQQHAFLWANGKMSDLGTLGGVRSQAFDINEAGHAVGFAETATGTVHAVLWANGAKTDLGTLGPFFSVATGINALDQVVGYSPIGSQAPHAFIWADGKMTDLGTVGKTSSLAHGLGDDGRVVGAACDKNCLSNDSTGILWQDGKPTQLQTLLGPRDKTRWIIDDGWAISNSGQITGSGTFRGKKRAYLLRLDLTELPTPVPASPTARPQMTATPAAPTGPPREVAFGDAQYLYDRTVTLDRNSLTAVGAAAGLTLLAREKQAPFAALYTPGVPDTAGQLRRYLPEQTERPGDACPAEVTVQYPELPTTDKSTFFAFAGYERDITPELLTPITNIGNVPVLGEPAGDKGYVELFLRTDTGLQRYVVLSQDGVPAQLTSPVPFAGQKLTFAGDVTNQISRAGLVRVGCAGPFKMQAAVDHAKAPFTTLYASVGNRLLAFTATAATTSGAVTTLAPAERVFSPVGSVLFAARLELSQPPIADDRRRARGARRVAGAVPRRSRAPG